jgi:hypothetical protein
MIANEVYARYVHSTENVPTRVQVASSSSSSSSDYHPSCWLTYKKLVKANQIPSDTWDAFAVTVQVEEESDDDEMYNASKARVQSHSVDGRGDDGEFEDLRIRENKSCPRLSC